jgi:hypothetical protein
MTVPTTRDATPGDPAMHYFIVIAEDGNGGYHLSDPDSIATTNELGAQITSIVDVPNDDGRSVSIAFDRDSEDANSASTPVQTYDVYRRDDLAPVFTSADDDPGPNRIEGWTYVASAPAHGAASYTIEAPTIGDSTISKGDYNSTFFVRATTSVPATYFDTSPGSGYSLDNLAPPAPTSFVNVAGMLSWDPSTAGDFDYYTVYGANTVDFASAIVVDYAVAQTMDVTLSPYALFFVTATDESGNEGPPASLYSLTGTGGTPLQYVLSVTNYPNPFNPNTTIKYTVPHTGTVSIVVYDTRGLRVNTLVDNRIHTNGAYAAEWHGRDDSGSSVATGVYFAHITHAGMTRTKKLVLMK